MKNKKLLQKAGALILSAALAVSCLSGVPAATAKADGPDLSKWKSEIYIDFGTGTDASDLATNILLAQDGGHTCTGSLIAGYGTWTYDSTDVGTVHGGDANGQKIGFDRKMPVGVVSYNNPGAYFRDWIFSPDGKPYTFSVDLPAGQYYVYVYTGTKAAKSNNISKVSFSDNGYQVVYDQTSAGGGQCKWPSCEYVINVDEKIDGCGYGTVGVKIFDDTIVTTDNGYDDKYTSSNTVFFEDDTDTDMREWAANENPDTVKGKIVTARLNGIEFLPVANAQKAESVVDTETDISVEVGLKHTLAPKLSPETATERIEYISSNPDIAAVDPKTGEITGIAAGSATITATTPSLIGKQDKSVTYNVTVHNTTTLELAPATLTLETDGAAGANTGTIKATFSAASLEEARTALEPSITSSIATAAFGEVEEVTAPTEDAKGVYSQDITITATAKGTQDIIIARTTGRTATFSLTVTKPVTSVAFYDAENAVTDKYSMVAGTKLDVKAKGLPEDASNTNVKYRFKESTDIATISASGRITAKKSGTAVIVATSASDSTKTAEATLTITPGFEISYPAAAVTMTAGQTKLNELKVTYKEGVSENQLTNKKITYTSNNETVAKVSEDGTVTALKAGTATITATAEDGGQSVSYQVTVKAATRPATDINVKTKKITLDLSVKNKKTAKIIASLVPANSTDSLTYSVPKNCKAIKVDNTGKVTALKAGSAKVTVKSTSGKTKTVSVTVKASATKVKIKGKGIKKNKITLKKGRKLNLTATVTPKNSTDKVKWSTNKKKIASIKKTKKGVTITAKKKGKAVITAKAGKKSAKITITVK